MTFFFVSFGSCGVIYFVHVKEMLNTILIKTLIMFDFGHIIKAWFFLIKKKKLYNQGNVP